MNCLIIYEREFFEPGKVRLLDERARHAMEAHELKEGLVVTAGVLNGALGRARVIAAGADGIELEFIAEREKPARLAVEVVLAVPRPQTVKKTLQLAATLGIERLSFVKTEGVVKSYLQSKSLLSENVENELLKGLEQGCDTRMPEVRIFSHLRTYLRFFEEQYGDQTPLCLIADTHQSQSLKSVEDRFVNPRPIVTAIGPESGWAPAELDTLKRRGFIPVSLGPRMLRVDSAMCYLLGQIALLLSPQA